jgi:ABC-2 type transport system ATP-binding protein
MLQVSAYKKSYEGRLILQVDALSLPPGLYWLKGANGCGKSTFLKSIAGIIPFEGRIQVEGVPNDTAHAMQYRRLVNYGEAEPQYPGFLRGVDFLEFYRQTKQADKSQVTALLQRLDAQHFMEGKTSSYSSGMLKKLSLVLAFTGNPRLLLLDEPLVTLDVAAVATVNALIREQLERGVSVLFTSHQEFAGSPDLPVQVLQLAGGRLLNEAAHV